LLIWTGSAGAGVLKVKVPVNEFEQMESRLEALENENRQLKMDINSLATKPTATEKAVNTEEITARINALEQENNQLKKEVASLTAESSGSTTSHEKEIGAKLDSLGRENRRLKQSVAALKEVGALQRSDSRTASHQYFETNKKFATHIFK
jgi:predicted  nucleic acid-binding Zn-ribbon protein